MKLPTIQQSVSTMQEYQPGQLVFITGADDLNKDQKWWSSKVAAWPVDGNVSQNINDWIKSVLHLDPGTPVLFLGVEPTKKSNSPKFAPDKARILYGERVYTVPLGNITSRISIAYSWSSSTLK